MNIEIYNERVAKLQLSIRNLEKNIMNPITKVDTLADFNALFKETKKIVEEYRDIFENMKTEASQEQLLKYLEKENNFLEIFWKFLNKINHYHDVIRFVPNYNIKKEWTSLYTILEYHFYAEKMKYALEKTMSPLMKNPKIYRDNSEEINYLKEKIQNLEPQVDNALWEIENLEKAETDENLRELDLMNGFIDTAKLRNETMYKKMKETIESIDFFLDTEDFKDTFEKTEETVDNNIDENFIEVTEEKISLNKEYLDKISLPAKIKYMNVMIEKIENLPGKKMIITHKGEKIKIAKKYLGWWIECQKKLKQYTEQFELEIEGKEAISLVTEIEKEEQEREKQAKEKYADLYMDYKYAQNEILRLSIEAKKYLNTKEVIAVASLNGEPIYVKKENLEHFNRNFMNYKKIQLELQKMATRNHIEVIEEQNLINDLSDVEENLYEQIHFLQNQGQSAEVLEKIESLKSKLYNLNKGKKFALYANLKVMFKTFAFTNDMSTYLSNISEDPEKLVNSKEYTLEEKRDILTNILEKIEEFSSKAHEKSKDKKEKISNFGVLKKPFEKVKKSLNLLPKNLNNVFKIKNTRDSKSKKIMAFKVAATAVAAAGMVCLTSDSVSIMNKQNTKAEVVYEESSTVETATETEDLEIINAKEDTNLNDLKELFKEEPKNDLIEENNLVYRKIEIPKSFQEQQKEVEFEINNNENHYFGEEFTTDGDIYQNQDDLANNENKLSSYFDNTSIRTVEGIVYNYNGSNITIFSYQPDAEATIKAIENNGAKQIGYVGKNEQGMNNGYEGFFADENVHFVVKEEGKNR